MREPITSKGQMYKALAAGLLGNTTPQWFDVYEWWSDNERLKYGWWGVRTMTPGGPCLLSATSEGAFDAARLFKRYGHKVNISPMIDKFCTVTAWLELWDSPTGLVVEGVEYPDTVGGWTWRNSMPDQTRRKRWEGVQARMVLRRHLNENSLDDVAELMEQYQDHVLELSAVDRCIGIVPHRNHIVWELRSY